MSENKLDNSEDNIPNLSEELSNIANNDDNNNKKQKKRSKLRIILYIIGAVSAFGVIGFVSIIVYVYILSLRYRQLMSSVNLNIQSQWWYMMQKVIL